MSKNQLANSILECLKKNSINAMTMKFYSKDDDIDIVIIDKNQYKAAKNILKSNHWFIKNNKSKIRERDKDFFKNNKHPFFIHLHQAFSWNTVTYLNSEKVWKRRKKIKKTICPSPEDELLIIAAHSLFENQHIKPGEVLYGRKLLKNKFNLSYMEKSAKNLNWKKGLKIILSKLESGESFLSISELLSVKISKIVADLGKVSLGQTVTEIFNYFFVDWVWNYRLLLKKQLKKAPVVITLSGVDGSGKSTQANLLRVNFIENKKTVKIIHVGGFLSKKDVSEKHYKIPGTEYLAFAKDLLNILLTYITNYKADILIYDRYIYDTLVKIAYKKKVKRINQTLLSLSMFFLKPKSSFIFEVPPKSLSLRDSTHSRTYFNLKCKLYKSLSDKDLGLTRIRGGRAKKAVNRLIIKKCLPI